MQHIPEDAERRAARLFSSSEARQMLEEFRALVRAGVLRVTADNDLVFVRPLAEEPRTPEESPFDAAPADLAHLREQVVERLADRILADWETAAGHTLREEVIDRITARILKRWNAGS